MNIKSFDIESAIKNNNYKDLMEYVKDTIYTILDSEKIKNLEDDQTLWKDIEALKCQNAQSIKKIAMQQDINFAVGMYVGMLETIETLLRHRTKMIMLEQNISTMREKYGDIIYEILAAVYENPGCRDEVYSTSEVAVNILHDFHDIGLLRISCPGKYEYYYPNEDTKIFIKKEVQI